jgi:hypothetical protein
MPTRPTSLTGAAGEHFVMFELLRRGYVAALVAKGVPNVDILVSSNDGEPLASLQVKTMGEPRKKWQMKIKHEHLEIDGLFYCFVRPAEASLGKPTCWIIPSRIVAEHIYLSHRAWLSGTPKPGQSRNDGDGRSMHFSCEPLDKYPLGWMDQYKDNWEILEQ